VCVLRPNLFIWVSPKPLVHRHPLRSIYTMQMSYDKTQK
jgi:hypothetical protein